MRSRSVTTRRKRALVIHYFFPPLGGAGVPRILNFVKYLPAFGWDVTVLTTASSWYGVIDATLLAEVPPEVQVVRAGELPIAQIRRKLINPAHRLKVPGLTHYIGWPDETSGWLPAALLAALRVVRGWKPDVILSSSYPYTAHLVGRAVSRSRGLPWVADFRDPWIHSPQSSGVPWPLQCLNARAERALVRHADRVIIVDERLELEGLSAADPHRVVIPNGADGADLELGETESIQAPSERFRLTYVGSLYGDRDAAPVFRAIARLIQAGVIDSERFELSIVGNVWLRDRTIASYGIPANLLGYVDHARAVSEMRNATALLFYAPSNTWAPSGKIFEYLISGRPILCAARRDNLAHQLVDELGAGAAVEPDDTAAIERAVELLYTRWLEGGSLPVGSHVREQTLARFSRRRLTGRLAQVLDDVVGDGFRREPGCGGLELSR